MVYKHHSKWRNITEASDSSYWGDDVGTPPEHKTIIKNMRRSHPRIPYTLEVECNSYWGSFEREFIAYSMGILDDVQMGINFGTEYLKMFWKGVFDRSPMSFDLASDEYELLKDYLFETFQTCDDWEQLTFYNIDWEAMHKEKRDVLIIQLAKPLSKEWEDIVIPRMRTFFDKKVYEYMNDNANIIGIKLYDSNKNLIKTY